MIHDDGEYLRDPRPFDGHRVLVHRGITQPATAAASATAGSGEGDGKGEAVAHVHEHGRPAMDLPIRQCPRCTPLLARIAELERQRDEVLALHKRMHLGGTAYICHEDDESWPCDTVAIYGGGE